MFEKAHDIAISAKETLVTTKKEKNEKVTGKKRRENIFYIVNTQKKAGKKIYETVNLLALQSVYILKSYIFEKISSTV